MLFRSTAVSCNRLGSNFAVFGIAFFIAPLLSGCAGVPDEVEPVTGFELGRYLGTWYEIARLDHPFERGLSNITAEYSLREADGVRVINRGYSAEDKEWKQAEGKAFFVGDEETAMLKVSFFGPFYGGYNVIELDKQNYEWALVAGQNRAYLWILSRSSTMEPAVLEQLLETGKRLGFPVEELIWVDHDGSTQIPPAR